MARDIAMYRIDRVPERSYRTFLKLAVVPARRDARRVVAGSSHDERDCAEASAAITDATELEERDSFVPNPVDPDMTIWRAMQIARRARFPGFARVVIPFRPARGSDQRSRVTCEVARPIVQRGQSIMQPHGACGAVTPRA